MDRLKVSTVVYAPPADVYDFLVDFENYGKYSEYVRDIRSSGDGGVGTEYAITFGWWKLTYTARSRVVDMERPERIDWRVVKDLKAHGSWLTDPVDPPDGREDATEVTLDVHFDPHSVGSDAIDLPRLVNIDWVIKKAVPLIRKQATTVLRRVVEDLEGQARSPELRFEIDPDSVEVDDDSIRRTD